MRRGCSRIYWCILDLPQQISSSHCHHQVVIVTSEATQEISVLWMYMDYDPISVVSCRGKEHNLPPLQWLSKNLNWEKKRPRRAADS
jgi:hypothetical protein